MEALKAEPVSSRLSSQKESAGDDELSSRDVTTDTGGPLDISESETLHRDSPDSDATDTDPISPSVIHLQPGFSLVANSVVIIRSDYSPCKPQTYTYHFSIVNNTSEPIKLNYQPILHPFQEDSPQSSEALIPDNSHSSESSSDLPLPKFTQCTGPDSQSEKAVKTEPIDYSITMNESGTEMESSHEMGEYPIRGQESDCDDHDDDMESDTEDLLGQNSNPYGGLPSTSFQSQVAVKSPCRKRSARKSHRSDKLATEAGSGSKGTVHAYPDNEHLAKEVSVEGLPNLSTPNKSVDIPSFQVPAPSWQQFKCEVCGKSFTKGASLKRHMRTHMNVKPYVCKTCGKAFTVGYSLKVHERIHTGERPFKCTYPNCDKAYTQWLGLDHHVNSVHTGIRNYLCDLCGSGFLSKSALNAHVLIHAPKTDEKPFKCEYCDKSFRMKPLLAMHTRIHTGQKPHKCRYCELAFISCGQRSRHERIHTGEKPYKCEHCGKAFRQKKPCIEHMNIHTGERPYKCRFCDKKFASNATVYNHEKMHKREAEKKMVNEALYM